MAQTSHAKRPHRPSRREITDRIARIHAELMDIASAWDLSNGELRYRLLRLERRLRRLLRQLQD